MNTLYNIRISCILLGACMMSSCNDFLTEYPTANENVPNFYKTENDIAQGVNAAYNSLASSGQYGKNFIYLMEVRSDNASVASVTNSGGIYGDIYLFKESPYNVVLNDTWVSCYDCIKRCNIVLDRIDNIGMSDENRNKYTGEMLFVRALTHFNLVRLWGDVPLATHYYENPFDAFAEGRTPVGQVYDQIKQDLLDAIRLLPDVKDKKRPGAPNSYTAKALLAKVYLTLGEYTAAKTQLEDVIGSNLYSFIDDYADIFNVANKNNSESIFEIQYSGSETGLGSAFANIFAPPGTTELTGGVGTTDGGNIPTEQFANSYSSADKRKAVSIGTVANGSLYCKKFVTTPVLANQSDANFIVMRYTEVLMMYAEVLNELTYSTTGDAMKILNKVRARAGLPAYEASDLPDKGSFGEAIMKERRYEFAFENIRWFDLVRTRTAVKAIKESDVALTISEYQMLYPVPQRQIDTAPGVMTQNPNY